MGVYYSSTVAYGVATNSDSWIGEEERDEWLEENGLKDIFFECGGDMVCGKHVNLFYIPNTYDNLNNNNEGFISLDHPEITDEQMGQLTKVCALLNIPTESIGWKLVFNVY